MIAPKTNAFRSRAVLSLLAATTVAFATPALAQHQGYGYGQNIGREIDQRQAQLEQRVQRMAYDGRISRQEYRLFQRQFQNLDRLQWSFRRDGYSRWERAELHAQLERIHTQIRHERREARHDRRDDRYDRRW